MSEKEKDISLEDKLGMLDQIIERLQSNDISLEDAFNEYSKGVKLVGECEKSIDRVEKKVQKLMDDGSTEDFE